MPPAPSPAVLCRWCRFPPARAPAALEIAPAQFEDCTIQRLNPRGFVYSRRGSSMRRDMNKRFKVVITDFAAEPLECSAVFSAISPMSLRWSARESELVGRIEDADAVMLYHSLMIGPATTDSLKHCRLIVRCGVGFDNVDGVAARRRGIPVANVPDYGTEDVADTAIGMALTLSRGIHLLNSRLRNSRGAWSFMQTSPLSRLRGGNLASSDWDASGQPSPCGPRRWA